MDLPFIFRRFFGINSPPGERDSFFESCDDDDEECDLDDMFQQDDIFQHFHEEMQRQMGSILQQMDDIFKHSGSTRFFPGIGDPGIGSDPPASYRDRMLKQPDTAEQPGTDSQSPATQPGRANSLFDGLFIVPRWNRTGPQKKEDIDLDAEVKQKGLSILFDKPHRPAADSPSVFSQEPRSFSSHSSVSITTIRGADGKLEEKRTVRDSDGREETTITHRIGDKSHTVIRKNDGMRVETNETFQNMDEKEVPSFENLWDNPGRPAESPREDLLVVPNQDTKVETSLFKKLFGIDLTKPRS